MARVGGRNAYFAWIVGIGCAAILAVLAYLALPLMPASMAWVEQTIDRPESAASAAADDQTDSALPAECDQLYSEALWAALRWTPGAVLNPSTDAPVTTATALVDALQPTVLLTCSWVSDSGTVSTTLAEVATDAGAIAAAALPASGFSCTTVQDRTRCTRTDGELVETIESGGGLWLSTSQTGWRPADYVARVAERVWSE